MGPEFARAPVAVDSESLPDGRKYRPVPKLSDVTLRDLIEREGEGS
jgi:hypothetical protein